MTSFTDTFNAGTINPAWVAYANYNVAANTQLSWPTLTNTSANIVAGFMQVQTTAGIVFTMPDARITSQGTTCIFDNTGGNTFTVVSNSTATQLLSVASNAAWVLVLANNSTQDGTWLTFQLGAGSSTAQASALAGLGLVAIGSTLNQQYPFESKNANYLVVAGDRASTIQWTGGSGTLSLTTAATLGTGFFFNVNNQGTGTLTISDAGGATINGAASILLNPGDSAIVTTNGTLWVTIGLGKAASFAMSFIAINVAPGGTITLAGLQLNQIIYRFTGTLTQNCHIIVPNTVQQYWVDNETSGNFTLDVGTSGQVTPPQVTQTGRAILYCDASNVYIADTLGVGVPLPITQGGTGGTTQATAQAALDVPSNRTAATYALIFG